MNKKAKKELKIALTYQGIRFVQQAVGQSLPWVWRDSLGFVPCRYIREMSRPLFLGG